MKPKYNKPNCPKCGKEMRLLSTGSLLRTFHCENCNKTEMVKREDIEDKRNGGR